MTQPHPRHDKLRDGSFAAQRSGQAFASNVRPVSCCVDWVGRRLGSLLSRLIRDLAVHRCQTTRGGTQATPLVPRLTALEPRIVLNATAELSAIGGLFIFGDLADDEVRIQTLDDGDSIQLFDASGMIIPIAGHNGGVTGNPTDPLAVSAISGSLITVDLGDGDDLLDVELPDGIHLTVLDTLGDDRTELSLQPNAAPSPVTVVAIESETIQLSTSGSFLQFADRDVTLIGNVFVGSNVPNQVTEISVGTGEFEIQGKLTLVGATRWVGSSGDLLWSDATVSAASPGINLLIEFDPPSDSIIELGTVDDSAGSQISELRIVSASEVSFNDEVRIEQTLSIDAANRVEVFGSLSAGSVEMRADEITAVAGIEVNNGTLILVADDRLDLQTSIANTTAGSAGEIALSASGLLLSDITVTSRGGEILLSGLTRLRGDVRIDSAFDATVQHGGDIDWIGAIISNASGPPANLSIHTIGMASSGNAEFHGAIGGSVAGDGQDLQSLVVSAGDLLVGNIGTQNGSIQLSGHSIQLWGSTLRSSSQNSVTEGAIRLVSSMAGEMLLMQSSTQLIADGDVLIDGNLRTLGSTDRFEISSVGSVQLSGLIRGGSELTVVAQAAVQIEADVSDWTSARFVAADGIQLGANRMSLQQLTASESIEFENSTVFGSDAVITTATVRFAAGVSVADNRVVEVDAAMIDAVGQTALIKQGAGEFALLRSNSFSSDISVIEGTLRVDGSLDSGSLVRVFAGAVLAGNGEIKGSVNFAGGTLAPSSTGSSTGIGQLQIGTLTLSSDTVYQVAIAGAALGQGYDSVHVNGSATELASAILEFDFSTNLAGDTELLLVQNDSSSPIVGRFRFGRDADGNLLATPRELAEGALVLNQFGISAGGSNAQASPAYITYFGGDGNDVAIVISGAHQQVVERVTLVERNGVNLEIRTSDSLANAQLASPTVRPIAGLQGSTLFLDATVPQSELYIDIDGFIDVSSAALHVDTDIVFDASLASGSTDQGDGAVNLLDSNRSSQDAPQRFAFSYSDADDLELSFDFGSNGLPDYRVVMVGVDQVDLALPASRIETTLTASSDQLVIQSDLTAGVSRWELTSDSKVGRLRFQHPDETFLIDGGDQDDFIRIESFGTGFAAVPTVLGSGGSDAIVWDASVVVGNANVMHDLLMAAESVTIDGDLRLVGGGSIHVSADSELIIRSLLDATAGQILIESNALSSDLESARLFSAASQVAVALRGGDYRIGNVIATAGTVELGGNNAADSIGSVMQSAGSGIDANVVTANSRGVLDLGSMLNDIEEIELQAADDVVLLSSADDVTVTIQAGRNIAVDVAGIMELRSVYSDMGTVQLTSQGQLRAESAATGVHVAGARVQLSTGIAYPGQSVASGSLASIGSALVPIRVSVSEQFNATTSQSDGSIYIDSPSLTSFPGADGLLPVGLVNAGLGQIVIAAAQIEDDQVLGGPAIGEVDLIGLDIFLSAESGIGADRALTATGLARLEAVTLLGSIEMNLLADRSIDLSHLETGGGSGTQIDVRHFGRDRLSITSVVNRDGDVSVLAEQASIDVLSTSGGVSLSAGGEGDLVLKNLSENTDITIRGQVSSAVGDVIIAAQRNLVFLPAGQLNSAAGAVVLSAGNQSDLIASVIALQDGSMIDAGDGLLQLDSLGDVFVSSLRSNATGSAIRITSTYGSVIDSGDQHMDIVAAQGSVEIDVSGGIGNENAVETEIGRLSALVRQPGRVQIVEASELQLVDVATFDGSIAVTASGTLTVRRVYSQNASGLDADWTGDIRLSAIGADSDLLIESIATEITGAGSRVADVELFAGDDVLALGMDSIVVGDDLRITSLNHTADGPEAIRLQTAVNDLELSVLGDGRGDVQIDEQDSIRLASSDRQDDSEVLATTNGQISIQAAGTIIVSDDGLITDGETLRGDVEIIAGGANGRLRLVAGEAIQMGDAVQLFANQSVAAAVFIQAPTIELGTDFQIETGAAVGVARWFAPRPQEGLTGTAFYDATTVTTNRLEQAAINDATGLLSIDIGSSGERGLTINIDWGAATDRFQQIDLLSGDAPPLQVEHLYLEQDILESLLNGRTSATDPLEVRFSVRHHESILVMGSSIQQSASERHLVEGELLSSTDNPLTEPGISIPGLENGNAQFIIPALSIPVAFFPVRDVIPTIEEDPVVISQDQRFVVLGSVMETTEVVASTTTAREEYFQIRVLSADPEGEDLIAPMRLPDDIISGDKLKLLFQSLPDGRYDLQYVLGDGNVRSILSVDLRDGKPIAPGNDADGGTLRLLPVDPEPERDVDHEPLDRGQDSRSDSEAKHPVSTPRPISIPTETPIDAIDPLVIIKPTVGSESRLSVAGRLRERVLWHAVVAKNEPVEIA